MSVTFKIKTFEGPLDLLLQLVEKNERDLSAISLAAIADQFVQHLRAQPHLPLEEVADFLVVAAKLMYLKSKLLLPSLAEEEVDEGPSLEDQLRQYHRFVEASRGINQLWKRGQLSFSRPRPSAAVAQRGFRPPHGVSTSKLREEMQRIISRLEPMLRLSHATVERVLSLQEKISQMLHRMRAKARTTFRAFVGGATKAEMIVSFLALLELARQRYILVTQGERFQEIWVEAHPDAPVSHSHVYETRRSS